MKRNIKLLSFLLAVLLAFSVFPVNTVYAVEGTETVDTRQTEEFALPDIVPEEEATERGYIGRVKEEEKDNYTFVFKDSENTRTMRVYSHPVKYTDKDGNTKDITLDIRSRPGGGFETKDNSIKTTFGAKLSDGIRLQSEDVDIKLIPANSLNQATLSEDNKTVSYTLDTKTTLEYSLTYTGFKEDIVVNEYTGQTEYEFLLYTNGLTVKEEMGSYYLADEQGNRKANIGDIIIFTADERNNTFGELSCEEIKPNYAYLLTIHVDAEYLKDEKTVYPIRIDPTLEVTGAGAIEDVTVYTGTSYYSGTSGVLYVGTADGKVYRSLVRFPGLEIPVTGTSAIVNASLELRDLMCQGTPVDIECRTYLATADTWAESEMTTWASVGSSYVGARACLRTVYYGNGNVTGNPQRYSFDITSSVRNWVNGTQTPEHGLVFKALDSVEAQASTSTEDRLKYFGSYNRSDYKPSLTIEYSFNAMESYYSDAQDDYTNSLGVYENYLYYKDDGLQLRANCYGYAIRAFYAPDNFYSEMEYGIIYDKLLYCYLQQPGEFADKTAGISIYDLQGDVVEVLRSRADLNDFYAYVVFNSQSDNTDRAHYIMQLIKADMNTLGYTVTEYTGTSVPSANAYSNRRLIALVAAEDDFHFYMQHSDNTWSHKPGWGPCMDTCFCCESLLTNSSFFEHAPSGNYEDGVIKLFYITKSATTDWSHLRGTVGASVKTNYVISDLAGNKFSAAQTQGNTPTSYNGAKINYVGDKDYYCFTASNNSSHTVTVTPHSPYYPLTVVLFDSKGNQLAAYSSASAAINFTYYFDVGKSYVLCIYSQNQTTHENTRSYNLAVLPN